MIYEIYFNNNAIIIVSLTPNLFPNFAPNVKVKNIHISEHGIKKYVFVVVTFSSPL